MKGLLRSLLAFGGGGLLGGLLVGLLDHAGGRLALGLDVLTGTLVGLGAGLIHPLIPPRLRALALLRAAQGRLRPGEHDALYDRCHTVTGLWLLALGLPLLLLVLQAALPTVLGRVRSPLFASLAVALVGLVVTGLMLAVVAPLQAGLARAFETLVRRRPTLSHLTRPEVHAVLALLAGLVLVIRGGAPLPGPGLAAGLLLATATLVGGELLLRRTHWGLLSLPVVALAAWLTWSGWRDPAARAQLGQAPALGTVLQAFRPSPDAPGP